MSVTELVLYLVIQYIPTKGDVFMETLRFDLSKKGGSFKMLNATNGGPVHKRHTNDQKRSNFEDYKALRIPYSRNNDSGIFGIYGGPYSHDITKIYRNFDADPEDPESYDFACTDESILVCLEAGTKTFFRLGETIEHHIKNHAIFPPKDFKKWAVICEHIIRHYTEGWADGYHLDMPYWEIWNEPDLDDENSKIKRTWTGTKAQFFDMYEITAKHLKKCFPHLKIGGPSLAKQSVEWREEFVSEMKKRNVPIDFFSWHRYGEKPELIALRAEEIHELLIKYGYENAESICDEYGYMRSWTDAFQYSINAARGPKGAAFTMACISLAQQAPIDMLMYYATLPSIFNGAFDLYDLKPTHGYYPLYWYGMFYDLKHEIRCEDKIDNIYTLCGVDENDKTLTVITYFAEEDDATNKSFKVDFGKDAKYEIYMVDNEHTGEMIKCTNDLTFEMVPNTCIMIKEI